MTKKNNCKLCGNYSGKRKVCKECKEEQPYIAAPTKSNGGIGGKPFVRNAKVTKNN